ncbi:hypothetical protein EV361DRAFT_889529 [Lentinula raphanica]|uniref:Uncharacterized protein n=1 Tax=Lentinula raphanica TaxID=153919 RepID=A0AA38UAG4_9AGAR|nr:hypothetical protein F5878DRAFT_627460 [Lentinula raphanica]KAJ3975264.1 hypothetical protein EV361DRAFT_889529 [Lentinula raphanica]
MVYSHTVLTAVLAVGAASTVSAAPLSAAPNLMGSTGVQSSAFLKRAPLPGSGSGLGLSSRELDARDLKIIFEEESQEHTRPHHRQHASQFGAEKLHGYLSGESEAHRTPYEVFHSGFEEHRPSSLKFHPVEDSTVDVELDELLRPPHYRQGDAQIDVTVQTHEHRGDHAVHEHEGPIEVVPLLVPVPVKHQARSLERRTSSAGPNIVVRGASLSTQGETGNAEPSHWSSKDVSTWASLKRKYPYWESQVRICDSAANGDVTTTPIYQAASKKYGQSVASYVKAKLEEYSRDYKYMERKAKTKGLDLPRMYDELGLNGGTVEPSASSEDLEARKQTPEYRAQAVLNAYPGWPSQVQRCGGDLTKTNVYEALKEKEKIDEPLFKAGVKILEDEWKACQKSSTEGTAPVSTPTAPRRRGLDLDFHFDRLEEGNPSGIQFPSGRSTVAAPSSPMGASFDTMDSSPLNAMGALPNAAAAHSPPSSLPSDHPPTLPLRDSFASVSALATPDSDVFHLHRSGSATSDFGHPDTVVDIEPNSPSAYAYDSYGDDLD